MKTTMIALAALLAVASPVVAQTGRAFSVQRSASSAATFTLNADRSTLNAPPDTNTTSFEIGGLPIILRRVTSNEVVAANLYLLGGTRQVPAEHAGLEPFLLEASERGTAAYPREQLREKMARLGSLIGVDPDHDWTTFALRSTTTTFDSTWAIFADRLMRPALDSGEVELLRGQLLSGVRQRRDSPDAQLEYLADSLAFAGHSYGIAPSGTEASLRRITLADL
ncbi:MAG: M16 family metallopeptidase, partial [Gemmatirosa sp.]